MARLRLLWTVGGVAALAALAVGAGLWIQNNGITQPQSTDVQSPYRTYTATGQVANIKPLGAGGCQVQIRLHQWVSLSDGFTLGEIPQKGQLYSVGANAEQCMALEVALASLGDPEDLESPRHIYYKVAQTRSGEWRMTENPSAPVGCDGL